MEYTKDTMIDGTVYERFEGTPEEIANLLYLQDNGIYTLENDNGYIEFDTEDIGQLRRTGRII